MQFRTSSSNNQPPPPTWQQTDFSEPNFFLCGERRNTAVELPQARPGELFQRTRDVGSTYIAAPRRQGSDYNTLSSIRQQQSGRVLQHYCPSISDPNAIRRGNMATDDLNMHLSNSAQRPLVYRPEAEWATNVACHGQQHYLRDTYLDLDQDETQNQLSSSCESVDGSDCDYRLRANMVAIRTRTRTCTLPLLLKIVVGLLLLGGLLGFSYYNHFLIVQLDEAQAASQRNQTAASSSSSAWTDFPEGSIASFMSEIVEETDAIRLSLRQASEARVSLADENLGLAQALSVEVSLREALSTQHDMDLSSAASTSASSESSVQSFLQDTIASTAAEMEDFKRLLSQQDAALASELSLQAQGRALTAGNLTRLQEVTRTHDRLFANLTQDISREAAAGATRAALLEARISSTLSREVSLLSSAIREDLVREIDTVEATVSTAASILTSVSSQTDATSRAVSTGLSSAQEAAKLADEGLAESFSLLASELSSEGATQREALSSALSRNISVLASTATSASRGLSSEIAANGVHLSSLERTVSSHDAMLEALVDCSQTRQYFSTHLKKCVDFPSSCLELKRLHPGTPSGVYNLTTLDKTYPAYCDMELNGGGWTEVMRISPGADDAFAYSSSLWHSTDAVNASVGNLGRDVSGTVHGMVNYGYSRLPFQEIRIAFTEPNNSLVHSIAAASARDLFTGTEISTQFRRNDFFNLLEPVGASARDWDSQPYCNQQGFNIVASNQRGENRCRFGIMLNNESNCDTNDAFVGIGCEAWIRPYDRVGAGGISFEPELTFRVAAWIFVR